MNNETIQQFDNTCRLIRVRLRRGIPTKWSTLHRKHLYPYVTREEIGEDRYTWIVSYKTFKEFIDPVRENLLRAVEAAEKLKTDADSLGPPGAHYIDYVESFNPKFKDVNYYKPQVTAAKNLLYKVLVLQHTGTMIYGGTGSGKTFVAGYFYHGIKESGVLEDLGIYTPWPNLFITKKAAVNQCRQAFKLQFGLDTTNFIQVWNYEALRTKLRSRYIKETTVVEQGEEKTKYEWNPGISPWSIYWDECQSTKNKQASITKIARSFSDFDGHPTWQGFCSATHGTSVAEMETMSLAMKFPIL